MHARCYSRKAWGGSVHTFVGGFRAELPNRFIIAPSNCQPTTKCRQRVSGRPAHLLIEVVEEGVDAFLVDAVHNKGEGVCDALAPFLIAERSDHAASTVGDGLEHVVGHSVKDHFALAILVVFAEAHRRATRLAELLDIGAST